jgi:hydroxymethylglutaryl-CoA lyase
MSSPTIPPAVVPLTGLPTHVTICEVGPRDGLQNEQTIVPVEVKAEFIERLVASGVSAIEVASFVRPDRVPQMADAELLLARLSIPSHVRTVVLTPNVHGLERALQFAITDIAIFASATESFSQRNLGCSIDDSFRRFEPVAQLARDSGVAVRAYVSMCFGDPWEGAVPVDAVVRVARRLVDLGATELSIGDTIGTGTPGHVALLVSELGRAGIDRSVLAAHFHDTYGQALANCLVALQAGVTTIDASAGGLGGCPFAQSATGNLATEDVLWQLTGLGIDTGVDLNGVARATAWLASALGRADPVREAGALTSGRRSAAARPGINDR